MILEPGIYYSFYYYYLLTYICLKETIWQISYDIVKDILVQGDRMRDTLQQLQDAVYLTKVHSLSLSLSLSCIDTHIYSHVGLASFMVFLKVSLFCLDVVVCENKF